MPPMWKGATRMVSPLSEQELIDEYAKLRAIGIDDQYHLESIGRGWGMLDVAKMCPACLTLDTSFGSAYSIHRPIKEGPTWICNRCGTIFDPEDCPE